MNVARVIAWISALAVLGVAACNTIEGVGQDVQAGGSTTFDVPATITGSFEVELEERVTQIAEITVNPS